MNLVSIVKEHRKIGRRAYLQFFYKSVVGMVVKVVVSSDQI